MRVEYTKDEIERRLPHLWAVLHFASKTGAGGLCFHRSTALCMDVPSLRLVIGTHRAATEEEIGLNPLSSPVPFLHCWTEHKGRVLSPSSYEAADSRLISWPIETYYAANGTHDTRAIPRALLMAIARKHGWKRHFLKNDPPSLPIGLPLQLLDAIKFPYRINARGGLLPA